MAYTAVPDMRMPYDNDGTVLYYYINAGLSATLAFAVGPVNNISQANSLELNDNDNVGIGLSGHENANPNNGTCAIWAFFPENREVTAHFACEISLAPASYAETLQGSTDSTNGTDGTWETASLPSGIAMNNWDFDNWRAGIKPVSFTGPKRVIRDGIGSNNGSGSSITNWHWYGEKAAGQTPDDIIFINHDDTPGVEYTAVEDFGDQPLGTTVTRQFRVKNTSATKTANTINIQCNDSYFAISEDGSNWVTTINITSLSAGAESSTLYVRCTTPSPPSTLGPYFNRIVVTVASYT
jgi:hypothetical protein